MQSMVAGRVLHLGRSSLAHSLLARILARIGYFKARLVSWMSFALYMLFWIWADLLFLIFLLLWLMLLSSWCLTLEVLTFCRMMEDFVCRTGSRGVVSSIGDLFLYEFFGALLGLLDWSNLGVLFKLFWFWFWIWEFWAVLDKSIFKACLFATELMPLSWILLSLSLNRPGVVLALFLGCLSVVFSTFSTFCSVGSNLI